MRQYVGADIIAMVGVTGEERGNVRVGSNKVFGGIKVHIAWRGEQRISVCIGMEREWLWADNCARSGACRARWQSYTSVYTKNCTSSPLALKSKKRLERRRRATSNQSVIILGFYCCKSVYMA